MDLPYFRKFHKEGPVRIYEDLDQLQMDLAEYIFRICEESVNKRKRFAIAMSGGSPLFDLLGKLYGPYKGMVGWGRWKIFWADEHIVPITLDNNYKQAKNDFLSKIPVGSYYVYPIKDSVTAQEAAAKYQHDLRQFVRYRTINVPDDKSDDNPKFDLIILGMGSDGHVASLFPDHAALEVKNDWVTYFTDSPEPPLERITFTFPVINASSNVAIVATGEDKADSVHLSIDDVDPTCATLPARLVQPTNGKLVWFLDKPAASKLEIYPPIPDKPAAALDLQGYPSIPDKPAASELESHPSSE